MIIKIRLRGISLLVLSIFLMGCRGPEPEQGFSLKALPPKVIQKNGLEIFQSWEFRNEAFLWDTGFVQPTSLKRYQDSLSEALGKDRFKQTMSQRAFQDPSYSSVPTRNPDSINAQLVHSQAIGKIRPIRYLESQLLDYQISRYPLFSHPTEFHGFLLFHDSLERVRVYFAASDRPWPPKPNVLLDSIQQDLKTGWTLMYHLHNHYEPKDKGYLGILAPSATDAQYYSFLSEAYDLKRALITNGFHTVEIQKEEFQQLKLPVGN